MTAKLPSIAVRNAMAFVGAYGTFQANCAYATRWAAERAGVKFNHDDEDRRSTGRHFVLTDEGRAIAATGTLAPCLQWAKDNGFRITDRRGGHKPKPGYIPLVNKDTGETAFVSSGRCIYRGGQLAFEGKPSRLAGGAK